MNVAPWLRCTLFFALCWTACEGTGNGPGTDPLSDGGIRVDQGDSPPPPEACTARPMPTGDDAKCSVSVTYVPPRAVGQVAIAGEWNAWTQQPMGPPDVDGRYRSTLRLSPGIYGYKVVLDGSDWRLHDGNPYRKYVSGVENSGLRVPDCGKPQLKIAPLSLQVSRPATGSSGRGVFKVRIQTVAANGQSAAICSVRSGLRRPETVYTTDTDLPPLAPAEITLAADRQSFDVQLNNLPDGKYTLRLSATVGGLPSEPLLLPFWIEAEHFQLSDTPLYMAVTDRFSDGDASNNKPVAGVAAAANFTGGDLAGVTQEIEAGYFDGLGVRALWLTPFYTQPDTSHKDQGGKHDVAGYHGYWPVRARQVDPRLGGKAALHRLVEAAHRHGIRVLMDAVLNHVHEGHEYFTDATKRDWFRTGCICGTAGCDWTEKRLECLFSRFMPDIDWTIPAASEQFIADTLWWLEEFDLDGLRIDAVKHVEDLAVFNLGARIRERFEGAGTRYPLIGETAMGWNEGTVNDNRENYDTIKRYMGGVALDGQFDFVWYHGVSYRVFAYEDKRFLHLDYWTHASLDQFGSADMVTYLGSHDTSRFITQATYRDASGPWARDIAYRKWAEDGLPQPPPDDEPYQRLWLGMVSLLTLPKTPLVYYGDEYGEPGGGDPDNRHAMRFDAALSNRERQQIASMRAVLKARSTIRGLRRGDYKTVLLGEDVYAFARLDPDPKQVALVLVNRLRSAQTPVVPLPPELGWKSGTKLRDALGGPGYAVSGTVLNITVPARSATILAPE